MQQHAAHPFPVFEYRQRLVGRLAEPKYDPASLPAVASVRLGLPYDFLWQAPCEQAPRFEAAVLQS